MINHYEDSDTVARLVSVDRMLRNKFDKIDRERYRNFNMLISDKQWPEELKQQLNDDDRPANAYNLISPVIKHITSAERGGRKKLQVVGRTSEDHLTAQNMTRIVDWLLTKNNWDYQKSRAALDAIIGRWGWIYQGWSYADDPEGMMILKRINPFRIRFDMDFSDVNLKDCEYIQDRVWYSLEEILENYALDNDDLWDLIEEKKKDFFIHEPETKRKGLVATWKERLLDMASAFVGDNRYREDYRDEVMRNNTEYFDPATHRFEVIEMHERRMETRYHLMDNFEGRKFDATDLILDQEGQVDVAKFQLIKEGFAQPDMVQLKRVREKRIWITTIIPAFQIKIQDKPYPIQNGNFMFTPIFAYDFHADMMETQSVVDELIDPQSDYNKRRSTILETLMRTRALGWTYEKGAIDDNDMDAWENPQIGGLKPVQKGFWGKVQADEPPKIDQAMVLENQESKMLIEEISGVNKAARGKQESSQEPAKAFIAKREQSEQMLTYLFDNLDMAALTIGRNTIDLAQKFLTAPREIRLTEDADEPEFMKINQRQWDGSTLNDITVGKYDLEISHAPYGRTAREIEYLKLLDIMEFLTKVHPQAAMFALPVLIKASDSPYRTELLTVVERLNGIAEQEMQQAVAMKVMEAIKGKLTTDSMLQKNQQGQLQTENMQREAMVDKYLQDQFSDMLSGQNGGTTQKKLPMDGMFNGRA